MVGCVVESVGRRIERAWLGWLWSLGERGWQSVVGANSWGGAMLQKVLVLASNFFLSNKNLFSRIKFITMKYLINILRRK